MRTVVLVVRLAKLALQTGTNLSTNTNTVSNLDRCYLVTDFDSFADNFMSNADWERAIAPAASDGMDIRAADSAAFNFDVDVTVFELLRFELEMWSGIGRSETSDSIAAHFFLLKVTPFALILDHVALEHLWVRHLGLRLRLNLRLGIVLCKK